MPAFATTTSTWPNSSTAAATDVGVGHVGHQRHVAVAGKLRRQRVERLALACEQPERGAAPANARAIASPIPREAPVTSTRLPGPICTAGC